MWRNLAETIFSVLTISKLQAREVFGGLWRHWRFGYPFFENRNIVRKKFGGNSGVFGGNSALFGGNYP